MKKFSELGITNQRSFVGDKIYPEGHLGKEFIAEFYEIRPSNKKDGTECLYMQIKLEGIDYLLFSTSTVLIKTAKQMREEDFPITAKLIKVNRHYEFR